MKRQVLVDLGATALLLVFTAVAVSYLDVFEWLYRFSREHEDWELDEVVSVSLVLVVSLGWFSFRRWREARREMAARMRAEANLRRSEQLKLVGRLTGGVAHEFNNILAVIVGNLGLVTERIPETDDKSRKWLRRAMNAALRGKGLTDKLLTYASNKPLQSGIQDIGSIVRKVAPLLAATSEGERELKWSVQDGLWPAVVNQSVLENALLNLVINANQATTDDGCVRLRAFNLTLDEERPALTGILQAGDHMAIEVGDEGAGMAPDVIEQATQPFFTTRGVGQGAGLGLSMVYGFAKQSGGHLEIESRPGQGTTVRILLPRATLGST